MYSHLSPRLLALIDQGVQILHPESTFVAEDVPPGSIAAGVVLHPCTRLLGATLSIGPGCVIGGEAPATVHDCQLGHGVALKGGFFQGSVFLDQANVGSCAHVRPGCLLEEEANAAHGVGLKQTILFPFVTLGSLINFCDVLMAGGTSRKRHSEVGSSFIHFNYTPQGDKATASLLGDVPRGVLLDGDPIFLGGQGGLVGPLSAEYGTVQAAGSVSRHSLDKAGHLYLHGQAQSLSVPYDTGRVRDARRRLEGNLLFLGNLFALRLWYDTVRKPLMDEDPHREACRRGARALLDGAVSERLAQLDKFAALLDAQASHSPESADIARAWPALREALRLEAKAVSDDAGLRGLGERLADLGKGYVASVQSLSEDDKARVRSRLQSEVLRSTSLLDR